MLDVPLAKATARRPWIFRDLPVFPAVALELIDILEDPAVSIRPVIELLKRDPVLCAEVLRTANSARFQRRNRITDLQRAVAVLGNANTRRIALQAALRGLVGGNLHVDELRRCWEHCVRSAAVSEALAPFVGHRPEKAYTAGLLHDIGRLALLALYPDEYARLLQVAEEKDLSLLECERALFDIDHCKAGAWVTERWRLPADMAIVAAEHHNDAAESRSMLSLVAAAQNISTLVRRRGAPQANLDEEVGSWVRRLPVEDPAAAYEAALNAVRDDGGKLR